MRAIAVFIVFCGTHFSLYAQDAQKLVSSIFQSQKSLKHLSYTMHRVDSFVSGDVWNKTGKVRITVDTGDSAFGFRFWGRRDDREEELLYDGHVAYEVQPEKKGYLMVSNRQSLSGVLGYPGGQMVMKDLVRLDTTKVRSMEVKETPQGYELLFRYPDNQEDNVTQRYRWFLIDKNRMLPVEIKDHLVAWGKKQVRQLQVSNLKIEEAAERFDFERKPFLETYKQLIRQANDELKSLLNADHPELKGTTFDNAVFSGNWKGKVVLLDFWEAWCGPCVASMPKVQSLFDRYKDQGLQVYGVINEEKNLDVSKAMVAQKGITFPMLVGAKGVKEQYKLRAVPLYIVIGRNGKVVFVQEGFSDDLETAVRKALTE